MDNLMSEKDLKQIIRKYHLKANGMLVVSLLIMICVDSYYKLQATQMYAELGLPSPPNNAEFVLLIAIPFIILNLCVYIIEKVLIDIYKSKVSENG